MMRWSRALLDTVTSVVVIVTGCLLTVSLIRDWQASPREQNRPRSRDVTGESVARIQPLRGRGGVVVLIRQDCSFCESSLPFYARLAASMKSVGLKLVIVMSTASDGNRKYLDDHGLKEAALFPLAAAPQINTGATPSVLVFGPNGIVQRVWSGFLTAAREEQVRVAVAAL